MLKKTISIVLACMLLASPVMATVQTRAPIIIGFTPLDLNNGSSTFNLNAANDWFAMSFVPADSKTISKINLYATAVAGTLDGDDLSATLYSDGATGLPDAIIEARLTVTATPTGAAWVEFTGFTGTSAVTAGTRYWIVFKNLAADPVTNNPTYQWAATNTTPFVPNGPASEAIVGWSETSSTDGGTVWSTSQGAVGGLRIEYSDGSFDGFPSQSIGYASLVYSARELGVYFTSPSNAVLKMRCVGMYMSKTGTPTGSVRFRYYTGSTPALIATTSSILLGKINSGNVYRSACFTSTQTISPGVVVRIVMGETTQSDTSADAYRAQGITIKNDANSKAIMPFGGTLQGTYYDGATWAQTDTLMIPIAIALDTDLPFGAISGIGVFGE